MFVLLYLWQLWFQMSLLYTCTLATCTRASSGLLGGWKPQY